MRFTAFSAVLFVLVSFLPGSASAANKLIAVLPLDVTHAKQKLDPDAQASLEEMLRDVATDALASQGWTVLATQNMLQTLRDNGVDPTKCGEEDCQVSTARELKAAKFISGAVQWVEGDFTASIRLIDTETGQILSSARLEGDSVKALRRAFEQKATDFFVQGRMITGTEPQATSSSEPPPTINSSGPRVRRSKVTAAVGTLTVTAKPRDLVRLDIEDPEGRKSSSGAPFEDKSAKPGTWKIVARASGYGDEQQTVVVSPDDVTLVKFDLQSLGGLSIDGTPQGAAVSVSGPAGFHDEGGLPWEASGLHAGQYSIHVSRSGYLDDDRTVEVKPGETATTQVTLQKGSSPSATPVEPGVTPATTEMKRWGIGGLVGLLGSGGVVLPKLGATADYKMPNGFSYFGELGLTLPTSALQVGFAYSVGVRWYFLRALHIDDLHLGVLLDGWAGRVGTSVVSASASLYTLDGEVGYDLNWGAFALRLDARVGYALAASVGDVTATGASAGSTAISYGAAIVPMFRF